MRTVYVLGLILVAFLGVYAVVAASNLVSEDRPREPGERYTGYLYPTEGIWTHHNSGGARANEAPLQRMFTRSPRDSSLASSKNLNLP